MASLWASRADLARLRRADSTVLLVGSYDGSGNYGDVLQAATAIESVRRLPRAPLPVAIVEHETLDHQRALLERFPDLLADAAYLQFKNDQDTPAGGLVELEPGALSTPAVLYVYGGGFLNQRWGGRKVDHAAAGERLFRGGRLPVVASGLQVEAAAVAAGGVAHELVLRATSIGARDRQSWGHLEAALDGRAPRIELGGDDAVPFLRGTAAAPEPIVNFHVNDGVWVSEDPQRTATKVVAVLLELARGAPLPLRLQPIVAYEDPRVSERSYLEELLARFGVELEEAGYALLDPVDLIDDAMRGRFARFNRARLTVACSYHVTLTSLLAGIPALLFAENDYYDQKAAGLRDLFGLEEGLVGARGTPEEARAAVRLLLDGSDREGLVAQLRAHAPQVVERHGQAALTVRESLSAATDCPRA